MERTVEANRALREMGMTGKRGRKRKQHVDAVAASLLLRTYIDRERARQAAIGPKGVPS